MARSRPQRPHRPAQVLDGPGQLAPERQPDAAWGCGETRLTGRRLAAAGARGEEEYNAPVRGRFRIVDPVCLDVLQALRDAFDAEGLPFALAGGMGVQALLGGAGLDHLLRATGNVEIVVNGEDARIVRALNRLAALRPGLTVVQNPAAKNARVGPLNVDWINEPSRLRGMEGAWARSVERGPVVRVRGVALTVQQPEVLVAAKLTGQKVRPQDELDVAGVLQAGVVLDEALLRNLVAARPERFEVFVAIRERMGQG